jgi:predicted RNA binding protein YcfA (HicA-like mRNA interferase family)
VREDGKGSHRNYRHPRCAVKVTIAGKGGDDAKHYQEKQVADAIEKAKP